MSSDMETLAIPDFSKFSNPNLLLPGFQKLDGQPKTTIVASIVYEMT
jgi:hypothetical protein